MTDSNSSISGLDDISGQVPFILNFSQRLANLLQSAYAVELAGTSTDDLAAQVQSCVNALLPDRITLATTRPDFDSICLGFMNALEQTDAWKDTSFSSTGQMLLRALSTGFELDQLAIMRALQEAYAYTALNDSSIYLTARDQGVRIQRNTPSQMPCLFTRRDIGVDQHLGSWRQFLANSVWWFNRNDIHFTVDSLNLPITLTQGQVFQTTYVSSGGSYQTYAIGTENGLISDVDIRVFVDGVEWTKADPDQSIWDLTEDDTAFFEKTLPNTNVEILFGNGIYGQNPTAGAQILIMWAENLGLDGNETQTPLTMQWSDQTTNDPVVKIVNTGVGSGGSDAPGVEYYRQFSGDRRGSDGGTNQRAVRIADFRAHAVLYPGVFDAYCQGQSQLAPTKRSFTNVVGMTLLTDPLMTTAQFNDFCIWFAQFHRENLQMLQLNPSPLIINLDATVGVRSDANIDLVRAQLLNLLVEATRPKLGLLGFGFYITDFSTILSGRLPTRIRSTFNSKLSFQGLPDLIEWVTINSPTADTLPNTPLKFCKLGNVNLNVVYDTSSDPIPAIGNY